MAPLATPGLQFYAELVATDPSAARRLEPTMSTYGIWNLEGGPKLNELYVVCRDGSIQSVYEPDRPIGWELIEDGTSFWYRVTQAYHEPKRCLVRYHSRVADPPAGSGYIGSVMVMCHRTEPQNAEVIEQKDEGEEVT